MKSLLNKKAVPQDADYTVVALQEDGKVIVKGGQEPTPPSSSLTKVWYKDGSYQEFDVTEIVQDKQTLSTTQFGDIMTIDKIYIGDGVTIGWRAFAGGEPSYKYDNYKHHTISPIIIGNNCKIESQAFLCADKVTEVIIGNDVIIGDDAFVDCKSLTSIEIPNSVTSIGDRVFQHCYGLTSVIIGNSVTSIGDGVFVECTSLKSVTIPDSVTSIGQSAFSSCTSLKSVTIGSGVTSIGNYAFSNCKSLTSITYDGTISQWNAITKGTDWNNSVPATLVTCTDGDITI